MVAVTASARAAALAADASVEGYGDTAVNQQRTRRDVHKRARREMRRSTECWE